MAYKKKNVHDLFSWLGVSVVWKTQSCVNHRAGLWAGRVYAKLGGKLKENERRTANGVFQTADEKPSQEANVVFVEPLCLSLWGSVLI